MANQNYFCLPCRTHARRGRYASRVPVCPTCGGGMDNLGRDILIPRRNDDTGWSHLQEQVRHRNMLRDRAKEAKAEKERKLYEKRMRIRDHLRKFARR